MQVNSASPKVFAKTQSNANPAARWAAKTTKQDSPRFISIGISISFIGVASFCGFPEPHSQTFFPPDFQSAAASETNTLSQFETSTGSQSMSALPENANAAVLRISKQMPISELQSRVDSAPGDGGMLGNGFAMRCRTIQTDDLFNMLHRTTYGSNSCNCIFSALMARCEIPAKRYTLAEMQPILNYPYHNSWWQLFMGDYVVRLKTLPASDLKKMISAAPIDSETWRAIHREIELRQIARSSQGSNLSESNASSPVDVKPYMAKLDRQLKRAWFPPKGAQEYEVVVDFDAHRNGSISNAVVFQTTGDEAANQAVLDALHRAEPILALPPGLPDPSRIRFTFKRSTFTGK